MAKSKSIFGLATVGTKGQIVIPVEARKELGITEGDKLIIVRGKTKHSLILLSHGEMDRIVNKLGLNDI
jgi:AbrB family looped-hinge helix DNA binding protein